ASPAATAAWLSRMAPVDRDSSVMRFLEDISRQHGGLVPSVVPISMFERAWVCSSLLEIGITPPGDIVDSLRRSLGPYGTPGGAGLPPDADTTSVVLLVLDRMGLRPSLDCLMEYNAGDHFHTWPDERTPSVTTNAHVLEALSHRLACDSWQQRRYGAARERTVQWLCGQQHQDGWWIDKWHASPMYATAASVAALARWSGLAVANAKVAVERAVHWALESQRPDGSWGWWAGTQEETAYGLHLLLDAYRHGIEDRRIAEAVRRGRARLLESHPEEECAPLWHDKDLYRPGAVVRATILAALARTASGVPDEVLDA